ncbi:hypothetical protein SFRURICE_005013 [Spodoptera frugiperda]|uniref:SFRICE_028142 n=1 Tax=Spodoptera frugiperda TaxID=7108 RepID=A0A2H1VRV3_SPOFR|nr:hypothetical protein SFRURICE_005013 [Spodoptera frugiperda]
MKRSKSYTWLSGLLRPRAEERADEEWGAAPWVRADVMHHDRSVLASPTAACLTVLLLHRLVSEITA